MSKVQFKKALLVAAALAVTTSAAAAGKLEIFSWWSGDEGPALEALVKLYKQKYSSVVVDNATVSGGASFSRNALTLGLRIDNALEVRGDSFAFGNPFSIRTTDQYVPLRPRTITISIGKAW